MPVDARGHLEDDAFGYRATKSGRVHISRGGRRIAVVAGERAERLRARLAAASTERDRQLLLAAATGNYRRGNERRGREP